MCRGIGLTHKHFQLRGREVVNLRWLITTRWQQHVGFESHPRNHFVLSPPAEDLRPPFRATVFRCTFGCLQARRGACRRFLLDDFSHVSALASCPFIGMQLPRKCGCQSSAAERSWPPFFGFHYLLDCSSPEPRRNGCGVLLAWWSAGGFFDFVLEQWCSKTKNRLVLVFPSRVLLGSPAHLAGATARLISVRRNNLKSAFVSPTPLSTARHFWYNICMKADLEKKKESNMKECCHCEQCGNLISSEDYDLYGCVCASCAIENL